MIYYEKSFVTISWNEADYWVEVEWRGFVSEEEFSAAQRTILTLLKQKRAEAMLIDTRKTGPINHAMQELLVNNINPQLVAAGLKYKAFVQPERESARISVDDAVVSAKGAGVRTSYFAKKEAAIDWLRDQPNHD